MLKLNYHWFRVVSWVVLVTFSSSVFAPALASPENPVEIAEPNDFEPVGKNTCPDGQIVCKQTPEDDEKLISHDSTKSFTNSLKETGGYVVLAFFELDDDQKNSLTGNLEQLAGHFTDDKESYAKFYTDYITHIAPLLTKAFGSKLAGRVSKNLIFSDPTIKPALPPSNSINFLMRNAVESTRNLTPMAKENIENGDYLQAGKTIRTSFILQGVIFIPIEFLTGLGVDPYCRIMSFPQNTRNMVTGYMRNRAITGAPVFDELSGRTSEKILSLEKPAWQFLLPISKTVFTIAFYFGFNYLLNANNGGAKLRSLALAESASGALVATGMFFVLLLDKDYEKYGIFNIEDGIWDGEKANELFWEYGVPAATSQLAQTVGGSFEIALMGQGGNEVLAAQKDFKLYDLVISSFISSSTGATRKAIEDSRLRGDSPQEINKNIRIGILTTMAWGAQYTLPVIIVVATSGDPIKIIITVTQSIAGCLFAPERASKEIFQAFKEEEMPITIPAAILKAAIPAGELLVASYGLVDLSVRDAMGNLRVRGAVNYAAMKIFSAAVPTLLYTIQAWHYDGETDFLANLWNSLLAWYYGYGATEGNIEIEEHLQDMDDPEL